MNCRYGACIGCSIFIILFGIFFLLAGLLHIFLTQNINSDNAVIAPAIFLFALSAVSFFIGCSCLCLFMVKRSRHNTENLQRSDGNPTNLSEQHMLSDPHYSQTSTTFGDSLYGISNVTSGFQSAVPMVSGFSEQPTGYYSYEQIYISPETIDSVLQPQRIVSNNSPAAPVFNRQTNLEQEDPPSYFASYNSATAPALIRQLDLEQVDPPSYFEATKSYSHK